MHFASLKGGVGMVRFLVDNGAHLLKPKKDGMTILHIAASNNDVHILDYALQFKETKSIDIASEEVK